MKNNDMRTILLLFSIDLFISPEIRKEAYHDQSFGWERTHEEGMRYERHAYKGHASSCNVNPKQIIKTL